VYLRRWRIETPWFSVRLHHWLKSDDHRNLHDHPWDFYTFILKGGYIDHSEHAGIGIEIPARPGHWYYRPATHRHWVEIPPQGAWTIIFTGPIIRRWGFWVRGKFKKANKYFLEEGPHPCD